VLHSHYFRVANDLNKKRKEGESIAGSNKRRCHVPIGKTGGDD